MIKNLFKRKDPKIEFVSLLPEVAQIMPIEPAKNIKYDWLKRAREDYSNQRKADPEPTHKVSHITRCPGISSINRQGWVQRAWQDISIRTNGDGTSFDWITPINQKTVDCDHNWKWQYVDFHPESLYGQYKRQNNTTLKTVIKIQSPWMVYIPKGYYLMSMPIPYSDRHEFTAATGLLDPDYGPNFLNVQIFWHVLDGEVHIPAGTPLCQYILIKKDKFDSDVRAYEQKDLDNLRLRANTMDNRWIPNYNPLKNIRWKK